jgi:hypothetical protein
MNNLIENELPGIQALRDQLLDMLSDQDLAYKLPGNNPTLGELCEEMGQTQQVYTQSFKTSKHDWGYNGSKPESPNSVSAFKDWYKKLDAELIEALGGLTDDDIQNKQVEREHGIVSAFVQFHIYREALLIFYGKASVYLKALEKEFTDQWKSWIG